MDARLHSLLQNRLALVCPIACVLFSAALFAQQSTPPILISAQNKDGSPADLSASDLLVRIDGKPIDLHDVRRIPRPNLQYCVLFDSSGSQRQQWAQQRDQTTRLLSTIPRPGTDYGVFVAFNDHAYLDAEGTDPQELIHAISRQVSVGGTALYDAMVACSDYLVKRPLGEALRVMFIFSDGGDNASRLTREKTAPEIAKAGIRIYAIGDIEGPIAAAAMRHFVEETGGKICSNAQHQSSDPITDLDAQLGNLFAVTPANSVAADRIHKLGVKCGKKNIVIIAPRQYCVPSH